MKRYNLKDGLGPVEPRKANKDRQRPDSAQRREPTQAERQAQAKAGGPIEIPTNLGALSVKELKNILDALGIKKDDCFEKADLIRRIEEYKENKKQSKQQPQPSSSKGDSRS